MYNVRRNNSNSRLNELLCRGLLHSLKRAEAYDEDLQVRVDQRQCKSGDTVP